MQTNKEYTVLRNGRKVMARITEITKSAGGVTTWVHYKIKGQPVRKMCSKVFKAQTKRAANA